MATATKVKAGKDGKRATKERSRVVKAVEATSVQVIRITPPNEKIGNFKVVGTAPYAQLRFSAKARAAMKATQEEGERKAKKKKPPRDFKADYEAAFHVSEDGWYGVPASGIRAAMVRACKLAGFAMSDAKVTLFVEADGIDDEDFSSLVRIHGKPVPWEGTVRNANGSADIRIRPMWKEWHMTIRIRYDADVFRLEDIANILARAGAFVGIGEGRPDSKKSAGLGLGTFRVETSEDRKVA